MLDKQLHKRLAMEATDDDFLEDDYRMNSAALEPTLGSIKPRQIHSDGKSEDKEDFVFPTSHTEWMPHHILAQWENKDGIRCISILINLSSGSANSSSHGIDVDLDDDGNTLSIGERWSDMLQEMDNFCSKFQQRAGEGLDDFTERRFAMRRAQRKMMQQCADIENKMVSEFRLKLPFRVEPTEMRVVFSGDKVGGRHCHVDLIEKKLQEIHEVQMMDDIANTSVPVSAKKQKYK